MSGYVVMGPAGQLLYCGPSTTRAGGYVPFANACQSERSCPDTPFPSLINLSYDSCALSEHFDGGSLRLRDLSHNPAEAILEAMSVDDEASQHRLRCIAVEVKQSS